MVHTQYSPRLKHGGPQSGIAHDRRVNQQVRVIFGNRIRGGSNQRVFGMSRVTLSGPRVVTRVQARHSKDWAKF